ncbi:MAG: NAD-binding protein, partial [Gemmatimonadota bacterium]|nr:NAD-binding protein [Gemmatimonadota bacterium]
TLGFGDITFQSDAGRVFSLVVLVSGVMFLLIVLPFSFIQFFYAPWLEAQSRNRAPRELPEGTTGHVILTGDDPVTRSLIARLTSYGRSYALLEPDVQRALEMYDEGVRVVLGNPDDLESYRRLRAADAAMVVATGDDFLNTNIAFTVRELTEHVPIVATVRAEESEDILGLAGSSHVLRLTDMLGRSLARRTLGGATRANEIGRFGELRIAEAPATGTPLVGKTLRESRLREVTGLTVVGLWERGHFEIPHPDTPIEATTVLVLAGSAEQMARFDELTCIYNWGDAPVLILGGGRVGRAAAAALGEREIDFRVVEKDPARIREGSGYVLGSAADLKTLERAGIHEASSVIVTTNDDAANIYLTIYCRRLNGRLQIVSRATLERNVSTLHRAGADFVMSYASMGANAIFNVLEGGDVVMLAEGLDVFRVHAPAVLQGRPLIESGIRAATGCSVVALESGGETIINPSPEARITANSELILIGTVEGERRFVRHFRR